MYYLICNFKKLKMDEEKADITISYPVSRPEPVIRPRTPPLNERPWSLLDFQNFYDRDPHLPGSSPKDPMATYSGNQWGMGSSWIFQG